MFTDKFISFPCVLYNRKEDEKLQALGIDTNLENLPRSTFKFDPTMLVCYYASTLKSDHEDGDELPNTTVDVNGGGAAELLVSIKEFERQLNEFWENYYSKINKIL